MCVVHVLETQTSGLLLLLMGNVWFHVSVSPSNYLWFTLLSPSPVRHQWLHILHTQMSVLLVRRCVLFGNINLVACNHWEFINGGPCCLPINRLQVRQHWPHCNFIKWVLAIKKVNLRLPMVLSIPLPATPTGGAPIQVDLQIFVFVLVSVHG